MLNISVRRIAGDFAAIGLIYIYRYELEAGEVGGGPLSYRDASMSEQLIRTYPNPFVQDLSIEFLMPMATEISVDIYDITGRLVKGLYEGVVENRDVLWWRADDEMARTVPQGVYFMRITSATSDKAVHRKIIKID